jgi:peptidyl-prolyl cis-trans isomerase D
MLEAMRKHAQGWVAWGIILFIILALSIWGVENYIGQGKNDQAVAKVNGIDITYQQLEQELARLQLPPTTNPQIQARIKQQALQQLINAKLLLLDATKTGYRIAANDVMQGIQQIPAFQVDGRFSQVRMQQQLPSLGYTPRQFFNELRSGMLAEQISDQFMRSAFALNTELQQAVQLLNQQRDFTYLTIPIAQYVDEAQVSKDEISAYYASQPQLFQSEEQVSLDYIELKREQFPAPKISEKMISEYYQANLNSYRVPAQWRVSQILIRVDDAAENGTQQAQEKIDAVYQQLAQGKKFAELAKTHSEDIASRKQGGEIGWISANTFDADYIDAVKTLAVNSYSKPFKNRYGYSIIQLLAKQEEKLTPLAEVKAEIKAYLIAREKEALFTQALDELTDLVYANPDSLQPAAEALNLAVQSTPRFTRLGDDAQPITQNRKIIEAAFSEDVLIENFNSHPLHIDDDTVTVIRVKQHFPQAIKPLETVEAQIRTSLSQKKARDALASVGLQIIEAMNQGESPEKIAKQYQARWQSLRNVQRYDQAQSSELLYHVFNVPLSPESDAKPLLSFMLDNGDLVILQVENSHRGELDTLSEQQRQAIKQQITQQWGEYEFAAYLNSLQQKAKIKVMLDN